MFSHGIEFDEGSPCLRCGLARIFETRRKKPRISVPLMDEDFRCV